MSVIFTDEEMTEIENLLGMEFIELYQKLWNERNNVKRYYDVVMKNFGSTSGWTKMYWEYKQEECSAVLNNQTEWFRRVVEPLKGKISDEMWSKLEDYLNKNEVVKRE